MSNAPAPSRATASVTLVAGLLSVSVKFYSGVEDVSIKREQYTADGKRVGSVPAVKNDDGTYGEKVDRADIVKRYPTDSGVLVDLDDEEIEALIVTAKDRAEIVSTHPFEVYDTNEYVPSGQVWQVRATPVGAKALGILLTALHEEELFALVKWCRSGKPYVGALFADGRLVGLRYDEEVRTQAPFNNETTALPEEYALGRQLVAALRSEEALVLTHPSEVVRAYAERKALARGIRVVPTASVEPIIDNLFATLTASIEAAKAAREKVTA